MNVTCRDVRPLIEPLASGDLSPDADVAAHLGGCPQCFAELSLARRLERLLASTPGAEVPPNFAPNVLRHLRRDWWRAEQHLDLWFNVAVAGGLLLVASGIWMLINLSGLTAVTVDASDLLVSGAHALSARVAPALPVYGAASMILVAAFGVWWWAERGTAM